MASSFWRWLGALAVLVLVGCWVLCNVFDRTTVDLKVHYGASTRAAVPAGPAATPTDAPATVAPGKAQASNDTKLIMDALQRLDVSQQARDAKQDERLDEFGRRLDSLSSPAPPPQSSGCTTDCVSEVQRVRAH